MEKYGRIVVACSKPTIRMLENLPFLSNFHYRENGFAWMLLLVISNIYINIYWIALVLIVFSLFIRISDERLLIILML